MDVLVTGGAGFIGSHVVDALVAGGHQVTVVDNLSTGKRANLSTEVTLMEVDLRSDDLDAVLQRVRPQAVFHLAAQASVPHSVADPAGDAEINVLGTINLLERCRSAGVRRVVYSSTGGALYGEPEQIPCTEGHAIRPLSPYGLSKYVAERYVEMYGRLHGLEYAILRYANVYGPRQDPFGEAGVVSIFGQRMVNGEDIVVFGDGTQERDFVYVEDVARANLLALERGGGQALNIGCGVGTSVNDLVARLRQATGYEKEPTYTEPRAGDVYRIALDASRAGRELGWEPKVSLEEGLRRTVASIRDRSL
ncbi:MAG: SDR family oxidoreductase [Chloroflexi bacterium]|nr:SDR family oxidoreductase [Chloroflexota bacterium]